MRLIDTVAEIDLHRVLRQIDAGLRQIDAAAAETDVVAEAERRCG